MINSVNIAGRLTADPELRTTTTGKNVCSFTVAVNKRFKPQDGSPDADFIRCQAWGQSAEYLTNYATKGRLVGVTGRIQTRKYTASDGTNREAVEVVADSLCILDRPREGGGQNQQSAPAPDMDEYDPFADQ